MTNPSQVLTSVLETLHETSQRSIEKRSLNEPSEHDEHEARHRRRTKDRKKKTDLPEEAKNTLLTLHVLFPHILLNALDLLDRGCVVRVVVRDEDADTAQQPQESLNNTIEREEAAMHHVAHYVLSTRQRQPYSKYPPPNTTKATANPTRAQVVQQLEDGAGYTVHLEAWNCSCPAFALAAYTESDSRLQAPAASVGPTQHQDIDEGKSRGERGEKMMPVRFGGLSIPQRRTPPAAADQAAGTEDARPDAGAVQDVLPPVCKHLLAVVLSEVAPGLFGPFAAAAPATTGEEAAPEMVGDDEERRGVWEFVVGAQGAAGLAAGMGSGW